MKLRSLKNKYVCPSCGNKDMHLIDDNGCPEKSAHFTLLCIARVKPKDVAHYDERFTSVGPDGLATCAMQWCPNE